MRLLKKIFYAISDSCFNWFLPSWRRKSLEAAASLKRYINYNRHSMSGEELQSCTNLLQKLQDSLFQWDRETCKQNVLLVELKADSLPRFKRNPLVEMVESLFVIMVVFLGIRTYFVQPFRIPTGSMQPSLNGIIIHPVQEIPSLPQQALDKLLRGSSYIEATADRPKSIVNISEQPKWLLFTETSISFNDGSVLRIPSAQGAVMQYLKEQGKLLQAGDKSVCMPYRAGETIIKARVDAGDMVLVNRISYHFRKPKRGETFVFDTRSINTQRCSGGKMMADQRGGTHYIKRLCGLPGDSLQVQSPKLLINGEEAKENTIARVAAGQAPYNSCGYQAINQSQVPLAAMTTQHPLKLWNGSDAKLREYAALGDNTSNSLDSRYWGAVRQFNIIGPAAFTLWPILPHFGSIE